MDPRLRTLRLARGMTLEALARKMGDIVTPMAISKYERGIHRPVPAVMARLISALGVTEADLYGRSTVEVEFLKYRKRSTFGRKEDAVLRGQIAEALEQRGRVQELVAPAERPALPRLYPVRVLQDAERAADAIRRFWDLGAAPVRNLTALLESNLVHVLGVETSEKFDGISTFLNRPETGELLSAAVVSRRCVSGERWRMNLAHELGHLVLQVVGDVNEEKAAFRFASALLAPAETLLRQVGHTRVAISLEELMDLRDEYGISIQALIYRLNTLDVLTERHTLSWWKYIAKHGWRKAEPGESVPEKSVWLEKNLRRAVREGIMTHEDAEKMLGVEQTLTMTGPVPRPDEPEVPEAGAAVLLTVEEPVGTV